MAGNLAIAGKKWFPPSNPGLIEAASNLRNRLAADLLCPQRPSNKQ